MTIKKPIRGIFFDLGWTLLRPATGDWLFTAKALEYIDTQVLRSISQDRLNEAISKANMFLQDRVFLTEEEELDLRINAYRTIAEMLPEMKISREQVETIAYARVYNDDNYVLFNDSKKTLVFLKPNYRIGIISDTEPSIKRVLKKAGIYDYFDNMTLSYEVGVTKPSLRIFEHALEAMGLPSEETVFIDDYGTNLDSASALGIQPILILSRPNSKHSTKYVNIKNISNILSYL